MTTQRFLYILILIGTLSSVCAQEDTFLSVDDFYKIKDVEKYEDAISDILNGLVDKKTTLTVEEIDKLIQIGEDFNSQHGLAIAYRAKGELHKRRLEYNVATQNFKKAIEYYKLIKEENGIARTYNDMFVVEYIKGNLEKGVEHLLESKKFFERLNDSLNLAFLHNNLGAVYWSLKDYKSSEQAFLQSLKLQENSNGFKIRGTIMSNLANIYLRLEDYKKAEAMVRKAIIFNKRHDKLSSLALSYSTLAIIHMEYREYQKAKIYSDSTMYLLRKEPNDITYLKAKQRKGSIELILGNFAQADRLLASTREAFVKMDSKKNLVENYKLASKLDSASGNLLGALAWQSKSIKISAQRMSEISAKKIGTIESKYKAELKQFQKIKEQERQAQRSKEELFRYRVFNYVIVGILLISLFVLISFLRSVRERKRLISSLHASNQIKNKLFSIISHDLKNEVHGLESSLNLMKDNQLSAEEFKEIVPLLAQRTNQTSILLNNLLNWSKSQMNELNAKPTNFDVSEVITSKFSLFRPKASQKNIELINKLSTTPIYADKDMVGIVAQNLIANAIKFCESGDSISLISNEKEDCYEIGFADTGVGIDPSNIHKLFAEDTFTTTGTQNETGTGLGLRICKELIELNKGNIKVESTLGEGTTFFISLPKRAA